MKRIAIVGAGGFGREVLQLILDINEKQQSFEPVGFFDDDLAKQGTKIAGLPIIGTTDSLLSASKSGGIDSVAIGVGAPTVRKRAFEKLSKAFEFPRLVHPSVTIGQRVTLEEGVIITAGNILTVDIIMQRLSMLNLACTVGHDAIVGAYSVVNPGVSISGAVILGEGAFLGTSSTILEGRKVGDWAVVGGGALVNRDVSSNTTVVGVPAKEIEGRGRESR